MMNIDKFLDVDLLAKSCPIPLPKPILKALANSIPFLIKKHKVSVAKSDVVAVAVDGAGVNQFLGANPEAQIFQLEAEKDGAPVFALVLIGKKPE